MTEQLLKTDFSTWERQTLEHFARTAADENRLLRQEDAILRQDLKAALAAWRKELSK
jgi:hypothetical protein